MIHTRVRSETKTRRQRDLFCHVRTKTIRKLMWANNILSLMPTWKRKACLCLSVSPTYILAFSYLRGNSLCPFSLPPDTSYKFRHVKTWKVQSTDRDITCLHMHTDTCACVEQWNFGRTHQTCTVQSARAVHGRSCHGNMWPWEQVSSANNKNQLKWYAHCKNDVLRSCRSKWSFMGAHPRWDSNVLL